MQNNYIIKEMNKKDLKMAFGWAQKEGWNPTKLDANCYYAIDSSGFLIGSLNEEPIATFSAVEFGDNYGFLGFYIVKPEFRGQGYGLKIWKEGMKRLEGRKVGLDGVLAQAPNYQKSGFKVAYHNICLEGTVRANIKLDSKDIVLLKNYSKEKFYNYDKKFFPENRNVFMQCLINRFHNFAIGHVDKNGDLNGYAILRKGDKGYRIAPLFADSFQIAMNLFLAINSELKVGDKFYFDMPEINPNFEKIVKHLALKEVVKTARMYNKEPFNLPLDKIYGITSLELG